MITIECPYCGGIMYRAMIDTGSRLIPMYSHERSDRNLDAAINEKDTCCHVMKA